MNEVEENDIKPRESIPTETEQAAAKSNHEKMLDLKPALEALLFSSPDPISLKQLTELLEAETSEVREALDQLRLSYASSGIELREVSQGFQFRTKAEFSSLVQKFLQLPGKKLSKPALETLAIVAYRQPVVKTDIERLRGVDVTPTLKTLLERKLVKIVGHQQTVGQPALYGTTEDFLSIFGLTSLSQLPTLKDLKELAPDPGETAEPEVVQTEQAYGQG